MIKTKPGICKGKESTLDVEARLSLIAYRYDGTKLPALRHDERIMWLLKKEERGY